MKKNKDETSKIKFQIYRPDDEIYQKQHLCVYLRELLDMAKEEQNEKKSERKEKET